MIALLLKEWKYTLILPIGVLFFVGVWLYTIGRPSQPEHSQNATISVTKSDSTSVVQKRLLDSIVRLNEELVLLSAQGHQEHVDSVVTIKYLPSGSVDYQTIRLTRDVHDTISVRDTIKITSIDSVHRLDTLYTVKTLHDTTKITSSAIDSPNSYQVGVGVQANPLTAIKVYTPYVSIGYARQVLPHLSSSLAVQVPIPQPSNPQVSVEMDLEF